MSDDYRRENYVFPRPSKIRSKQHRFHPIALLVVIVASVIVGGLALAFQRYEYGTEHTVTFTVQNLDDQASGSNGHKYLIFTTSGEEYENTDAWFHGKTDSSNVWNMLLSHPHGTFTCPVYGFRNTVLSSYPDLLDGCKLVKP